MQRFSVLPQLLVTMTFLLILPFLAPSEVGGAVNAYVTNEFDNSVSVIDANSQQNVATIPVGLRPIGIAAHPDGTRVYVANSDGSSVSVIDTCTNTVIATIGVGFGPTSGMAISPDGSRIYVGDGGSSIYEIDTGTNQVVRSFWLGAHGPAAGLAISPDGGTLYATSSWAPLSAITKINLSTLATSVLTHSALQGPAGLALTGDGTWLYVTNCGGSFDFQLDTCNGTGPVHLVEVETTSFTVTRTLIDGTFGALNGIAITPDNQRAYIIDSSHTDRIHVVDIVNMSLITAVTLNSHPRAITIGNIGPDGNRAFTPDSIHNFLRIIDVDPNSATYNQVLNTIPVGAYPRGVVVANVVRPEVDIISITQDGGHALEVEAQISHPENLPLLGNVNIYGTANPFPNGIDSITFTVNNTTCGTSQVLNFVLNGVHIGSLTEDTARTCTCSGRIETVTITDSALLANWDTSSTARNEIHADRSGSCCNTALAWIRVTITAGAVSQDFVLFDKDGGNANEPNLCAAGSTWDTIEATLALGPTEQLLIGVPYTGSELPSVIDVTSLTIGGSYILEITATDAGGCATLDREGFVYNGERIMAINNQMPDCSGAQPSIPVICESDTIEEGDMVGVDILGVTDPDGDPVTITITGITQDEPTAESDDDNSDFEDCPDGTGVGTSTAQIRFEEEEENGRIYVISFEASDGKGGVCTGTVSVCVPHDDDICNDNDNDNENNNQNENGNDNGNNNQNGNDNADDELDCVDDGQVYDSTTCP